MKKNILSLLCILLIICIGLVGCKKNASVNVTKPKLTEEQLNYAKNVEIKILRATNRICSISTKRT